MRGSARLGLHLRARSHARLACSLAPQALIKAQGCQVNPAHPPTHPAPRHTQVRDAARSLLGLLARRAWGRESRYSEAEGAAAAAAARAGAGGDAGGTVVVGALANSYSSYQLRLSARLAKEHPGLRWGLAGPLICLEAVHGCNSTMPRFQLTPCFALPSLRSPRSEAVALEVLSRQLAAQGQGQGALLSLCPWLEFITIPTQVGRPVVLPSGCKCRAVGCGPPTPWDAGRPQAQVPAPAVAAVCTCRHSGAPGSPYSRATRTCCRAVGGAVERAPARLALRHHRAAGGAHRVRGTFGGRALGGARRMLSMMHVLALCSLLSLEHPLTMPLLLPPPLPRPSVEAVGHAGRQPAQHGASAQLLDRARPARGRRRRAPQRRGRHRQRGALLAGGVAGLDGDRWWRGRA